MTSQTEQTDTRTATIQFRGYTNRAGYASLATTLPLLGELQNYLIIQRRYMAGGYRHGREKLKHQNLSITDLHRNDPRFTPLARRILEGVAKRVNTAWKRAYSDPDTGFPHTRSPYDFRTLEISEPSRKHIKITAPTAAELHVKGLPVIRFHPDHRLPQDRQPRSIKVTRHGRKITVSLTYNLPSLDHTQPTFDSCGLDVGIVNRLTTVNDRLEYHSTPPIPTKAHRKTVRRIKRAMQRCRDAAIRGGRARWVNHKLPDGSTKRRFRWIVKPSLKYLELRSQLQNVEHRRNVSLRNSDHRITSAIAKHHRLITAEDLLIKNMSSSNRGTTENPGQRVAQKRGLNRAIRSQRWGSLRSQLEYKALWHGRQFAAVPPHNTSRECPQCGHVARANRLSRDTFRCTRCRFQQHADVVAGENIRRRGVAAAAGAGNQAHGPAPVNRQPRSGTSRHSATGTAYAAPRALLLFTKIPTPHE